MIVILLQSHASPYPASMFFGLPRIIDRVSQRACSRPRNHIPFLFTYPSEAKHHYGCGVHFIQAQARFQQRTPQLKDWCGRFHGATPTETPGVTLRVHILALQWTSCSWSARLSQKQQFPRPYSPEALHMLALPGGKVSGEEREDPFSAHGFGTAVLLHITLLWRSCSSGLSAHKA